MTSEVHPVTTSRTGRPTWRRAANIAIVVSLVVGSVGAQAIDLTPVAIVLLVAAICALAPLFAPSLEG